MFCDFLSVFCAKFFTRQLSFFLPGRLVGLQTVIVGSLIIRIGFLFFAGVLTIITV